MVNPRAILPTVAQSEELALTCEEIRELLLGGGALSDVFQRCQAVRHALGFTQIRLGEFNGKAVRLHLWPRRNGGNSVDVSDIHSHPWPLRSFVLSGSIENRVHDVFEADPGLGQLYEVERHENHVSHTNLNTSVAWSTRSISSIQANSVYTVEISTFHSTAFTATGALTMIIAGERGRSLAQVIRTPGEPRIISRAPVVLTKRESQVTRETILTMLEQV
jgi:hypothetical protein